MALAILELLHVEGRNVRFKVDTGTNKYYQFRIGKGVRRQHGLGWIDDVTYRSPVARNETGGDLLRSSKEVAVPLARFDDGAEYVQLFSFKTPDGKSPAFSRVVRVRGGFADAGAIDLSPKLSSVASMNMDTAFLPPRKIPCGSYSDRFAQQASVEDLLASVVKIAGPAVLELLRGNTTQAGKPAQTNTGGVAGLDPTSILKHVLTAIMAGVPGGGAKPISEQHSLLDRTDGGNRFVTNGGVQLAQPFFLPALIPLLTAVAGPALQALPQLMNAANQNRLNLKQENNKLISDILGGINKRLLMDQILQAQKQAPAGPQPANQADLTALLQLLQQMPDTQQPVPAQAPVAPVPAPAPVPETPKTMSMESPHAITLSSRAIVSFVTEDSVTWNGEKKVVFTKGQSVQFKLRLDVVPPAPTTPLPRAILKLVLKDAANQSILCEKTSRHTDLKPGAIMQVQLAPEDVARLPINRPIAALAELRWVSRKTGKSIKALGSLEIVVIVKYSLKDRGKQLALEKELTDLKRFKPFWNKIWESPPLDSAGGRGRGKKLLWEIDVNAKYAVLLSADHPANGLMATKFLRAAQDTDSVSDRTEGRMKAGIELSIAELNKLLPLWIDAPGLDGEKLAALKTEAFARNHSGEFVRSFRLKGRAGENAMIWVAPIFNLFEFTLNSVQRTDDCGQVTAMGEEKVRFPLPVSARVLGLKSQKGEDAVQKSRRGDEEDETEASSESKAADGESPEYQFAGYEIEFSEKVALTEPTAQRQKGAA